MSVASSNDVFCARCGGELPASAQFCPFCGTKSAAPKTKRHPPALALAVFIVLAGVGAAALYTVVSQPAGARAVPGSPSAGAQTAEAGAAVQGAGGASGMPADHPAIDIPAEVTTFLEDLAKNAAAAPNDVEAWKKLARARYRAGMLNRKYNKDALDAVNHVLGLQPNDTEAIRMAANIAYEDERFPDAEREFRRYLELDSKDPGVRTDLASAILFQGRTDEARKMYTDIIATNPDFVQAHVNLGITLHSEGKREEALASFKRARELAKDPEQREHVERIIAAAEGRTPPPGGGEGAGAPAGGANAAPREIASNATSDFQRDVDRVFASHSILAPKIARVEWSGDATAAVRLRAFPMDQMPPVVRNKFKSTVNEKVASLAKQHGVGADVRIDMVDDESGRVMDKLDGKELIGAFDDQTGN
jgi:Flp pilus assembly protein TadD